MAEKLLLSALVNNHAGVLLRVAGLFSRRGFNISSLTVCETENPKFSRMTIVSEAEPNTFRQIEQQLLKLEDVIKVIRLKDEKYVSSELLLVKVRAENKDRPAVLQTISKYGARVKDIGHLTITSELTGIPSIIDEFVKELEAHTIIELTRSGVTALESGDISINDDID
ncbi:MAG: acetolactate synthase small subunit [Clostridiales bacterium]|nr:acetolactate synthase small subunit [Clostridiales bacterium]